MSVVLGVAYKGKIGLMSDGRVSGEDLNGNFSILVENYPKVIKVNDFVGIGFTGNKDLCTSVTSIIDGMELNIRSSIRVGKLFDILFERARAIKELIRSDKYVVQILVAGINEDGKSELKSTSSANNFKIESVIIENADEIIYTELSGVKKPHKEFMTFLNKPGNLADRMREYIDYIATLDRTVNNKHFQIQIDSTN